jgi:SAM-dependent methyltransferase
MKPEAYEMLAAREGSYWWHRARRRLALALLRKCGIPQGPRWLDLGCGPGGNLGLLDDLAPTLIVGTDLSPRAQVLAKQKAPRAHIVGANIDRPLPYADRVFDVVTIFNVLYHSWVTSEAAVLAEALRVLRSSGLLLVTEPAFPLLAREMDEIAMTRRRYRRREFASMCTDAGLDVLYSGYFTSFGFPLLLGMSMMRKVGGSAHDDHLQPAADMKPLPSPLNTSMYALARAEGFLIERGFRMPFGTTLICVARKPG